jgi:hypothetical protein
MNLKNLRQSLIVLVTCFLTLGSTLVEVEADIRSLPNQTLLFDAGSDGVVDMFLNNSGRLGIGISSPLSTLEVKGSFGMNMQSVSDNVTVSENTFLLVNSSMGNIILTLPAAASVSGRVYTIKMTSSYNDAIIVCNGSETIDGKYNPLKINGEKTRNYTLPLLSIISSGSQWFIISRNGDIIANEKKCIAFYPFNEGSGNVVRDIYGHYDGTTESSQTWTVSGNKSLGFNGSQVLSLGRPSELAFTPNSDEFSISCWFLVSGSNVGTLFGLAEGIPSTRQYHVYMGPGNGNLTAVVGGVSSSGSGIDLSDDLWHQVVLVNYLDSGAMKFVLYVDGVSYAGPATSGSLTQPGIDVLVGARRNGNNSASAFQLTGNIDKLGFYNYPFSAAEVSALFRKEQHY